MAFSVIYLQLSVKCRRNIFVYGDIGDCGISNKYFSTLCKIPAEKFRLEIRRWCFFKLKKNSFIIINIKLYKLIVKKPIMQIKLY
jgi:hypothetical protein